MRYFSHVDVEHFAPPHPAESVEPHVLPWPAAVAVIVGISAGLWVLIYKLVGALFGF